MLFSRRYSACACTLMRVVPPRSILRSGRCARVQYIVTERQEGDLRTINRFAGGPSTIQHCASGVRAELSATRCDDYSCVHVAWCMNVIGTCRLRSRRGLEES